ncbi:hypothetical protein EON80_02220 [bacterium]|nr:MAG: hypothetical protein EON80_02220 [bacterium]
MFAQIQQHSMKMDEWLHTRLWDSGFPDVNEKLSLNCSMEAEELPVLYSYIDAENWTLFTTRRVFHSYEGKADFVFVAEIFKETQSRNFKGYGGQRVDFIQLETEEKVLHICPFETGYASMGTLYALSSLQRVLGSDTIYRIWARRFAGRDV